MSSAYEQAVAFTDSILALRSAGAVSFTIGTVEVTAQPDPDLITGLRLDDSGDGLKTMRYSLRVPGNGGPLRPVMYVSAGPRSDANRVHNGFPEGTHYLYVHDADHSKALQVNLRPVIPDADEPWVLSAGIHFPMSEGGAVAELLRQWLADHGFVLQDNRVVIGDPAQPQQVLINLLTVGLLKQHLRGSFVLPGLADALPPRGMFEVPQAVTMVFRDYDGRCAFEPSRGNSQRLPPPQLSFRVEAGDKTVTMWANRLDQHTKVIETCRGDYTGLRELRDGFGLRSGDRVQLAPLGPLHYRLEKEGSPVADYPVGIFMRLGRTATGDGRTVDGPETMALYQADAQRRGHTWFSTNSLATGIGAERLGEFRQALEQGQQITVYFMVGKSGGGTNQIEFTARLLDLASATGQPISCPEGEGCPEFPNSGRIWLKLADLRTQHLDAGGFVVDGSGNNLLQQVERSQYQFGYIRRAQGVVPGPRPQLTEAEVVEGLCQYLADSGFRFARELVLTYWISLKTKPFVILTGLSGTGKSKLPWLVAEAIGARFHRVAVSPGWTEDADLLGYRNPLDPSGAFQSTDFTSFLLDAHQDDQDRLWFLCLDEMNLARVEHYFAKFLSAMEGLVPGDRTIRLHSGQDAQVPQALPVPLSFFFTGTVNMDETTHTFSPKVLDRANLVEFDVTPDDLLADLPPAGQASSSVQLTYSDFRRFCAPAGDARYRRQLVELARILYPVRAHFAFRVRDEIERFVANGRNLLAPEVLIDLQVHQKILPKLRGSGTALENVLKRLDEYCQEQNWPRSEAKVKAMLELLSDGITHWYA